MRFLLVALLIYFVSIPCLSAVILQYHHVSNDTPQNTSITPAQFEAHLKYLKENDFTVVPLSQIIEKIKKHQPLADKTVAITFDDAYINILNNATPLLEQFEYPYTIFVNPGIIDLNLAANLTWRQLKILATKGVIIANHGYEHNSIIRAPNKLPENEWFAEETALLLKAEAKIKEKTGHSWRYYAYPYGEYNPKIQKWLNDNNFVAFSQQSGAVGLSTDLTSVPRFPASMPYDDIDSLRDKLNSLPFTITLKGENAETIVRHKQVTKLEIAVDTTDFNNLDFNCYISGLGKQKINWLNENHLSITLSGNLSPGRIRCNCTAASISKPGRFYWYSKPWFVLKEDGEWYPL